MAEGALGWGGESLYYRCTFYGKCTTVYISHGGRVKTRGYGVKISIRHSHVQPDLMQTAEDATLGSVSKAVWLYLWTRPTSWTVRRADIAAHVHEGERALRLALAQLRFRGYLVQQMQVTRMIGENGKPVPVGSELVFCPDAASEDIPRVVEVEEPLAVAIGQMMPDPEAVVCKHRHWGPGCPRCSWEEREFYAHQPAEERAHRIRT